MSEANFNPATAALALLLFTLSAPAKAAPCDLSVNIQNVNTPDAVRRGRMVTEPGRLDRWRILLSRSDPWVGVACDVTAEIEIEFPIADTHGAVRRVECTLNDTVRVMRQGAVPIDVDCVTPLDVDGSKDADPAKVMVSLEGQEVCVGPGCPEVLGSVSSDHAPSVCILPSGERSRWHGFLSPGDDPVLNEQILQTSPNTRASLTGHIITGELLPHTASFEGREVREKSPTTGVDGCAALFRGIVLPNSVRHRENKAFRQLGGCGMVEVTGFQSYRASGGPGSGPNGIKPSFDVGRGLHPFDSISVRGARPQRGVDRPGARVTNYWAEPTTQSGNTIPPVDVWTMKGQCAAMVIQRLSEPDTPSSCEAVVPQTIEMDCGSTAYDIAEYNVSLGFEVDPANSAGSVPYRATLSRGSSVKTSRTFLYP